MSFLSEFTGQCRKPSGWYGRMLVRGMNRLYARLTTWGLSHISMREDMTALDIGCGGAGTIRRLANAAKGVHVYGIDYSEESVRISTRKNADLIAEGRVDIRQGSVSQLPYDADMFDLVTAIETHYFWPDLPADLREVLRVLKPGGTLIMIGGGYKGSKFDRQYEKYVEYRSMTYLTPDEHRDMFEQAGYVDVAVYVDDEHGWICVIGRKARSER